MNLSTSTFLQAGSVRKLLGTLGAVAALAASFQAAALPIVPVANRAALAADYTLVWAGVDATNVGPSLVALGIGVPSVTATATDLWLFEQDGPNSGFTAGFLPGDKLLSTFGAGGAMTLSFSAPVRGVGFNIAHLTLGAFAGTMEFFNAANLSLGSVVVAGTSTSANDGSASFLGGVSAALEISKVLVSVNMQGGIDEFAINDLSLVTTPVPEPTAALLFAFGLAGLALQRQRRAAAVFCS